MWNTKKEYDLFVLDVCATIGKILYEMGKQYGVSTCIADYTTYGYGYLDHNGFWQFNIDELENEGK